MPVRSVFHVTAEFHDNMWGGITTAVEILSKLHRKAGYNVTIISIGSHNDQKVMNDGRKWIRLKINSKLSENLYLATNRVALGSYHSRKIVQLISHYDNHNEAVVFFHNEEFSDAVSALESNSNITTVAVSHGLVEQEHPNEQELATQQCRFFREAGYVVVFSEQQLELIRSFYPTIMTVFLPMPLDNIVENHDMRIKTTVNRNHIIVAGRDTPQKGFKVLGKILESLQYPSTIICTLFCIRDVSNVEITYWGKHKHQLIKKPWLSRHALLEEIAKAHLMLVPSRFEPLGLIAAEGLALGVPIIATKIGGLIGLIGEDENIGSLIPLDIDGLPTISLFSKAIDNELMLGPRCTNGFERISKHYSSAHHIAVFENLFRRH